MEVIKEEPLSLWEVIKVLEKRRGDKEYWDKTDQRRVYEYAQKIVKLDHDDAMELLKILTKDFGIPKIIAVQIVNLLPVTINELEPLFQLVVDVVSKARIEKNLADYIPYLDQLKEFAERLEKKEEREKLTKRLLNILRKYWKKAIEKQEATSEKK